jgi:siderophore-iron reductase FhuF
MSSYHRFLNIAVDNIEVLDSFENDIWLPKLFVKDQTSFMASTETERIEARRHFLQQLFSKHINEVWDVLSSVGKIPKQTLWENTVVYIFWLYESVIQELSCDHAKEDFKFLLFEADGSIFGNYPKNPLVRFYSEKIIKNGHEIRPRNTCCLSYQIDEKYMCKSCPKTC